MGGTTARRRPHSSRDLDSFRADIEGLRAVAVILVVLDHLVGWPSGGFVGVDVFLVISGFLITGLLIKDTDRKGRISLKGFYARRARRILPAALTVLLGVTVASRFFYPGTTRVRDTQTDVLWALGFISNIHFSQIGTDYFGANRSPSLVQHFWSLAVEEQFYLVWPILILIVLTPLAKLLPQRRARFALLVVVGVGTASSFAWGLRQTATTPATAYFSTPVRAWELGVGAFIAVASTCLPGFFGRLGKARGPLSLLGLVGVLAGAFVVKAASGFPAPGAALPVLSTALVIIAGIGSVTGRWSIILTNPVSGYLGRISYSLYLAHWPVIVFVGSLMATRSWLTYPISSFITMSLTVACYHFIETPFRKFNFRRSSLQIPCREWRRESAKPATAAIGLAASATIFWALIPVVPVQTFGLALRDTTSTSSPENVLDASVAKPSKQLADDINAALASKDFPDFTPPLDELTLESAHAQWHGCRGAVDVTTCAFGVGGGADQRTALMIGDSFAMAWMPAVEAALPSAYWKIYGLARELCPAAYVSVLDWANGPVALSGSDCNLRHKFVIDQTKALNPDLVILGSSYRSVARLASKAKGNDAIREYQAGLIKTITMLKPSKQRRILTIAAPPAAKDLESCVTAQSVPADCVGKIQSGWRAAAAAEKRAANATHTSFSDTHLWFCNPGGYCPGFVGTTPVRWDGNHLTPTYARLLGPELADVIEEAMR
jgi:peptidoglycan/LPS O-acetylase OafA/YrhL